MSSIFTKSNYRKVATVAIDNAAIAFQVAAGTLMVGIAVVSVLSTFRSE